MSKEFRSFFIVVLFLAACSTTLLDRADCREDSDCASEFDEGWVCGSQGYCEPPVGGDDGPAGDCPTMVCDGVINIGNVSAQNGPNANLGTGMVVGIRTAFKEVNDAGGVMGRELRLLVRDDGYEPDNTGSAMMELTRGGASRKVLAIVGNVGTPTAQVAVPIAKEQDVVFHGAFTGAGVLREDPPAKVVFNYRSSYVQETAAIVRYLIEDLDLADRLPPQNIGVLAQGESAAANDASAFDGYGTAGFTGVAQALNGVVAEDDITKASYERNTSNVEVATETFVRWLGSDQSVESSDGVVRAAIIMVPTAGPASSLVIAMKQAIAAAKSDTDPQGITLTPEEREKLAKVDLLLWSVSFVGSDKLRENLAGQGNEFCPNVAVSQVVPFPVGASAGALRYQAALKEYAAEAGEVFEPGFVSFEGYLAGRLFADGLQNASSLDTDGLVAGLQSLKNVEYGIGVALGFSVDKHQASDRVWGTELSATCEFQSLEFSM